MRLKTLTFAFALLAAQAVQAPAQEAGMSDANRIVEISYPPGSYAATFRATMRDYADKQAGNEEVRKLDPNSAERMRIIYKVIDDEAARLGNEQEPAIREAMVKSAQAKFSAAELRDIRAFLETPSGRAYQAKMVLVADVLDTPQQQARMMIAMDELMSKIDSATAHLPVR